MGFVCRTRSLVCPCHSGYLVAVAQEHGDADTSTAAEHGAQHSAVLAPLATACRVPVGRALDRTGRTDLGDTRHTVTGLGQLERTSAGDQQGSADAGRSDSA